MQEARPASTQCLFFNRLESLPPWLFELPELAFLSFARNPCSGPGLNANGDTTASASASGLASISWADLQIEHTLGSGHRVSYPKKVRGSNRQNTARKWQ